MSDQYRIKTSGEHSNITTPATDDPKFAGDAYRNTKKNVPPGTTVTLQKRPVGPWTTIEEEIKQ
jgi:hypothetical protein